MFHIHILALMLSVAMSAEVELTIGDISTRHVKVGREYCSICLYFVVCAVISMLWKHVSV